MMVKQIIYGLLTPVAFAAVFISCQKASGDNTSGNGSSSGGVTDTVTVVPPTENPLAATIGFFGDDWKAKSFIAPDFTLVTKPAATTATVTVDMHSIVTKLSKYLFGNNSNLWMGQIVTVPVLTNYLTVLSPNIIRGPGGSISDVYFWNALKNQKPSDVPDSLVDANGVKSANYYWSGKNTDSWTFSLDNYYQLLQLTKSTGIITVNYAYARYGTSASPVTAAAHLAADWVRYDNGRTKYWEIGNESGGSWEAGYRIDVSKNKDGQPEIITGDLYGKHFKVFADSMRAAAASTGKTIYIGSQLIGHAPEAWQTQTDKTWNQGVLTQTGGAADFYIIHDYFTPYKTNAGVNEILNTAIYTPKGIYDFVKQQTALYGAPTKPIALTEWNITSESSMQQVSHIAGMHAVMTLGELIKNQFGEASRWDLANGWNNGNDHGLFNIGDEPGVDKWNPRPAYYHMYFFQKYFGDKMVPSSSSDTAIVSYGSLYSGTGDAGVVLVNRSTSEKVASVKITNFRPGAQYYWYTLTGGTDNGEFSRQVYVNGTGPNGVSGGPANFNSIKANAASANNGVAVTLPPRSVVFMIVESKK